GAPALGEGIDPARGLAGLAFLAAVDQAVDFHLGERRIDGAETRAAEIGKRAVLPALFEVVAGRFAVSEHGKTDGANVHGPRPLFRIAIYRTDIGRSKAVAIGLNKAGKMFEFVPCERPSPSTMTFWPRLRRKPV